MGVLGKTVEGTFVLISSMCYGVLFSLGVRYLSLSELRTRLCCTGARTHLRLS
jgi:hypothetical protein|eukprot:COSAG06_NODE_39810_length_408_cov_1.158576_2_plen_53_part_00